MVSMSFLLADFTVSFGNLLFEAIIFLWHSKNEKVIAMSKEDPIVNITWS